MDYRQRIEALESLSELRRSQHVSDQEFAAAKARLLDPNAPDHNIPNFIDTGAEEVENFSDSGRPAWLSIALKTSFLTVPLLGIAAIYLYTTDMISGSADYVVTANTLNCRAEPNVESRKIKQFSNGARVRVSGSLDGWSKVESGGVFCWVAREFLSQANSQPPTKPTLATMFAMPATPTPIIMLQCHMGYCLWSQVLSVTRVEDFADGELRRVILRSGSTFTQDGEEYPESIQSGDVEFWERETEYFACSTTNPVVISRDSETQEFRLESLNVASPAGYQTAAANLYRLVCHGVEASHIAEEELLAMGYFNDFSLPSTSSHKSLEEALSLLGGR